MTQPTLMKLTLSAWLLIGCAQTHLHASIDSDNAPDKTGVRTVAAGSNAQAAPAGRDTSDGGAAEVWVGQLLPTAPALCDPDHDLTSIMFDPAGHYDRVALILEADAQGQLSGRITFGEGPAPTQPGETNLPDGSRELKCSTGSLVTGVEYTVLEATRTPKSHPLQPCD